MEVFAARIGLTARGIVYILMGYLALLIARGGHVEVDQKSVLDQVLLKPQGSQLVGLLAFGFACYAFWRFYEALGRTRTNRTSGSKILSLLRGIAYALLSYTAFMVLRGSHQHQSTQQRDYAATIMSHQGGRWLIGAIGFTILIVGIVNLRDGMRLKFMRHFQGRSLSRSQREWIRQLGRIGAMARGFVFAITGALVISAAWTHNSAQATGIDGAVKSLRHQPFGELLLSIVAIGLIIFGIYGLAEARYRDI